MKKCLFLLLCLLLVCLPALSEEAQDITDKCTITASGNAKQLPHLFDNDYTTEWASAHRGYIEVAAPENDKVHGLYVSFGGFITNWCVEAQDDSGNWVKVYETEDQFYNHYIPLTEGYQSVRLKCMAPDFDHVLHVTEMHVLGAGEVPGWVQQWQNFTGKADIVLMVTDPGDEYLFFGGLIPHYVAQGKEVMLCVIVNTASQYKSQLLDGLWHCGMTNYPYIAYFKPNMASTARQQYALWSEVQFVRHVSRIVRIYKPDVLVTHSQEGEGIDGGHRVCADAAIRSIKSAVDSKYDVGYGYKLYGNWQLPKLYLHAPDSGEVTLDYNQPLDYFGGKTAFEIASEAYALQDYQKKMAEEMRTDGVFNGAAFTLHSTFAGDDTHFNDLFENIQ